MIEQAKALLDELHRERLNQSEYCLLWDALTLLEDENAQHRQAVEDGRRVELPCGVGDTVYFIGGRCTWCAHSYDHCHMDCEKPIGNVVCETQIQQFRILGNQFDCMTDTSFLASSDEHTFYFNHEGKTWWKTRAEAEAALLKEGT